MSDDKMTPMLILLMAAGAAWFFLSGRSTGSTIVAGPLNTTGPVNLPGKVGPLGGGLAALQPEGWEATSTLAEQIVKLGDLVTSQAPQLYTLSTGVVANVLDAGEDTPINYYPIGHNVDFSTLSGLYQNQINESVVQDTTGQDLGPGDQQAWWHNPTFTGTSGADKAQPAIASPVNYAPIAIESPMSSSNDYGGTTMGDASIDAAGTDMGGSLTAY